MQIQLLGREDISTDDATTLTERWRHYIESYTLVSLLSEIDTVRTILTTEFV